MTPHFEHAQMLFHLRRYREAANAYAQAASELPTFAPARSMQAACLINLGCLREAQQVAEESLAIDPENAHGFYVLSFLHSHRAQHKTAESLIREAIRIDRCAEYHWKLACTMLDRGRTNECVAEVQNALALEPTHRNSLLLLSQVQRILGEPGLSNETLRQALADHPLDAQAHRELGKVLLISGDPQNAIDLLQEARRLDPISANDVSAIAQCYGLRLWPFRTLAPYIPRWTRWPHRQRWLIFHSIAFFLIATAAFSDNDFGFTWIGAIVGVGTVTGIALPFAIDLLATLWGQSIYRRELQLPFTVHFTLILGTVFFISVLVFFSMSGLVPPLAVGVLWLATSWPFLNGAYRTYSARNPRAIHFIFLVSQFMILLVLAVATVAGRTVYAIPFVVAILALTYFAERIAWKAEGRGSDYVIARGEYV